MVRDHPSVRRRQRPRRASRRRPATGQGGAESKSGSTACPAPDPARQGWLLQHLGGGPEGSMDVTPWLGWFLNSLDLAVTQADKTLDSVLLQGPLLDALGRDPNERKAEEGTQPCPGRVRGRSYTNRKWLAIAKCSPDAALHVTSTSWWPPVCCRKSESGGRSTSYEGSGQRHSGARFCGARAQTTQSASEGIECRGDGGAEIPSDLGRRIVRLSLIR